MFDIITRLSNLLNESGTYVSHPSELIQKVSDLLQQKKKIISIIGGKKGQVVGVVDNRKIKVLVMKKTPYVFVPSPSAKLLKTKDTDKYDFALSEESNEEIWILSDK